MEESNGKWRTPGEIVGYVSEFIPGDGTYVWNDKILASLVGLQTVHPQPQPQQTRPKISVVREKLQGAVPQPGMVVTAKITKVTVKIASANIICVGPRAVNEKFTGTIRQQDVRATEIDKVDMHMSFRPGDIVRAEVVSLGDSRSYLLSTAKNELGVVSAKSVAGAMMVPISWQEMQCPLTNQKEPRKVAKV